ncbi:hypothetical protein EMIT0158MI4_230025 [Burkholderia ambifaria]
MSCQPSCPGKRGLSPNEGGIPAQYKWVTTSNVECDADIEWIGEMTRDRERGRHSGGDDSDPVARASRLPARA